MSCMESKFALRVKINELKGASNTDAYNYFVKKIGVPSEVEEWDGEVEFFVYKEKEFDLIPVKDYSTGNWAVDYLLQYSYDHDVIKDYELLYINDLLNKAKELEVKFNVPITEIEIVNYEWYNGGDEPVCIK